MIALLAIAILIIWSTLIPKTSLRDARALEHLNQDRIFAQTELFSYFAKCTRRKTNLKSEFLELKADDLELMSSKLDFLRLKLYYYDKRMSSLKHHMQGKTTICDTREIEECLRDKQKEVRYLTNERVLDLQENIKENSEQVSKALKQYRMRKIKSKNAKRNQVFAAFQNYLKLCSLVENDYKVLEFYQNQKSNILKKHVSFKI